MRGRGVKTVWARAVVLTGLSSSVLGQPVLAAENCREPETGTRQIPLFSPPLSMAVTGAGRLQFYAAPDVRCPTSGVFVIPKGALIAYAQSADGWSSVMYLNPRTGESVSGWVRSARLKATGTVGPR